MPATESYTEKYAREKQERTTAEKQAIGLLAQLATAFPGWTLEPSPYENHLPNLVHTATGARVGFNMSWPVGRLRAIAHWPVNIDGGMMSPRNWGVVTHDAPLTDVISFALDRPAATVAADLTRRLLRGYLPLFEACLAKKADALAQRQKVDATRDRLVAILRGRGMVPEGGQTIYVDSPARGRMDVGYTGDTVDLNLTLPVDLAEELCAKIARLPL
jgi:hypothetical protein